MTLTLYTVDAFTQDAFRGNPAAVCVTKVPLPDDLMQKIAAEMNLSETAFLVPLDRGNVSIRWFTPKVEVPLCGHGTLAGAHVLFTQNLVQENEISFQTRFRGNLQATRCGDRIALNLPATVLRPFSNPRLYQQLEQALGCSAVAMAQAGEDIIVEIASSRALSDLTPDFLRLSAIPVNAAIVTTRSTEAGYDFKSRYFAPRIGLQEDPVTGYAHCSLTPYWSRKLDKDQMTARQVSARGGILEVRMLNPGRVELKGCARTMLKGELYV